MHGGDLGRAQPVRRGSAPAGTTSVTATVLPPICSMAWASGYSPVTTWIVGVPLGVAAAPHPVAARTTTGLRPGRRPPPGSSAGPRRAGSVASGPRQPLRLGALVRPLESSGAAAPTSAGGRDHAVLAERSHPQTGRGPLLAEDREERTSAERHVPGVEVISESWSRTVAPGWNVRATLAATVRPVARGCQSRPHVVHSTSCRPDFRAATSVADDTAPYGGRNHRTATPATSSMVSRARRRSGTVDVKGRRRWLRWLSPWTADLVAAPHQLPGELRGTAHLAAQAEERGLPAQGVQGVEDGRGGLRVGTVIEGERHVAGVARRRTAGAAAGSASNARPPRRAAGGRPRRRRQRPPVAAPRFPRVVGGIGRGVFARLGRAASRVGRSGHARASSGTASRWARARPCGQPIRTASSSGGVASRPLTR